jgi:isopenicillin N synthase-like dioxygenase
VQCGECLQIISGGYLVATPHCVRASKSLPGKKVGRATFPVFVDTDIDFPLSAPEGVARDQVL